MGGVILLVYLILVLIVIFLIIDNPFKKIRLKKVYKKLVEGAIFAFGAIHGIWYWNVTKPLTQNIISGILLYGLIVVYGSAGKHKGIEDKVARKTFKLITWFVIWLLVIIHVIHLDF